MLAAAALLAVLGSAAAQGLHLPISDKCCNDNTKEIAALKAQLKALQSQFSVLQRSMQPALSVKQQLVQAG